jgi:hypothetical protein
MANRVLYCVEMLAKKSSFSSHLDFRDKVRILI